MKKGKFIVLEGPDKSGKDTQIELLSNYLYGRDKSASLFLTREPTMDSVEGKEIRELLKHPSLDLYGLGNRMTVLYIKDRIRHIPIIKWHLKRNYHVLCNRYKYSTMAYQSAQGEDLYSLIEAQKSFLIPDLTLIMNLEAEEAMKRRSTKGHEEAFDLADFDFHERIILNYLEIYNRLKEDENLVLIDASPAIEEVFKKVKKEVDKLFRNP